MATDPWLRMREPEIRRKLTYDPALRNIKITKGTILDDKNKSKLYRYEAINEISKTLDKLTDEKKMIKVVEDRFGQKRNKAIQIVDALKEKKIDKWEVLKNYKRVRKEVDGYITPTIEKDIIKNIETNRKDIKQIIKDAKRAQILYHRRVASGFTDYAEKMQEGRFSNKVDRVASALERSLSTDEGEGKMKISSANLGVKRADSTTSALGEKGEQKASAVSTEAHGITKTDADLNNNKSRGVPGTMGSTGGSRGSISIPLGH